MITYTCDVAAIRYKGGRLRVRVEHGVVPFVVIPKICPNL